LIKLGGHPDNFEIIRINYRNYSDNQAIEVSDPDKKEQVSLIQAEIEKLRNSIRMKESST